MTSAKNLPQAKLKQLLRARTIVRVDPLLGASGTISVAGYTLPPERGSDMPKQ
jgi:hypothetical protein